MYRWAFDILRRALIDKRCVAEGEWLVDHPKDSIRKTAENFCISKSQLHRDIHALKDIDNDLYVRCMILLRGHKRGRR